MNFDDPAEMLRWTVALAAFASLVVATELIAVGVWQRDGVFWRCCQAAATERVSSGILQGRINFHFEKWIPAVFVLQALAAITTLVFAASRESYREALFVLTACSLVVAYWRVVGGDGAQQMTSIILTACSLALILGGKTRGPSAALMFIGMQALLAYLVAGVAKVISPEWRNEDVVAKIASTVCYGNGVASGVIEAVPGLGRLLTLSVIAFELSMPLAVVVPVHVTVAFLGMALFFHVGCALVMGLNDFVWAFAATFPAILFVSSMFKRLKF
jgi:hypothetical protein